MTAYMIIAGIITCVAALVGTLLVAKDVSKQMKEYEEEGDSFENELARSHEYETTSVKVNLKRLTWIYIWLGVAVLVVSIGIAIYGKKYLL